MGQGAGFGPCSACGQPSVMKLNGEPCCLDCLDGRLLALRALIEPIARAVPPRRKRLNPTE